MIGVVAARPRRGHAAGFAIGALLPAIVLGALAVVGSLRPPPPPTTLASERRAFAAYERAVERATQKGGFVVTQGMQPGVADIVGGALPDATLVEMARGWRGSMERVRAELAAVEPPAFLREAARRYDAALAAYVEVAEALLSAAQARGAERAALIERVPPLGEGADGLWERAHAELERHRARLGLDRADHGPRGGSDATR